MIVRGIAHILSLVTPLECCSVHNNPRYNPDQENPLKSDPLARTGDQRKS